MWKINRKSSFQLLQIKRRLKMRSSFMKQRLKKRNRFSASVITMNEGYFDFFGWHYVDSKWFKLKSIKQETAKRDGPTVVTELFFACRERYRAKSDKGSKELKSKFIDIRTRIEMAIYAFIHPELLRLEEVCLSGHSCLCTCCGVLWVFAVCCDVLG